MTRHLPLLLLAVLLLAGCQSGNGSTDPEADYEPVPDTELYTQVETLPGVRAVDIGFGDTFGNDNVYQGTVDVDRDADKVLVLDRTLAILRQGRPGASMLISVSSGEGVQAVSSQYGLRNAGDLEARYGPQPGDGTPPDEPLTER